MVSYCCVKGCSNNSNNKKKDPASLISFHAFPSNQELKNKWLRAIGRPNWAPPSHSRVCSAHFNYDQINYDGCRIRIRDDAFPVNSLPPNSNFEASNVEACRICLATDVKMYSLQDTHLGTCVDSLTGLSQSYNIEGLPQYVCYQCAPHLIKCNKLIEKSVIVQATLLDIFAKHGQITKTLIKEQNRSQLNLKWSLNSYSLTNEDDYYFKYDNDNNTSYEVEAKGKLNENYDKQYFNNIIEETKLQAHKSDRVPYENCFKTFCNKYFKNEIEEIEMQDCKADPNDYKTKIKDNEENDLNSIHVDDDIINNENDDREESTSVCQEDTLTNGQNEELPVNCEKEKKLQRPLGLLKKKPARKKCLGLTPDETEMLKYFDIVKLSLPEQIQEWKKSVAKKTSSSEVVYECDVCSKKFANASSYRVHAPVHDSSLGIAECPVCKLRFKNAVLATSHAKRAHSKKFFCKSCPKDFNNVGVAKKHQRWHSGYLYKCATCPFSTRHESSLGVHRRRAHAAPLACALCGRAYVSGRGLRAHVHAAHPVLQDTEVPKEFRCEQCNIDFVSEGARRVHILSSRQHKIKPDLCDPSTEDTNLRNTCRKCGTVCSSRSELVSHTKAEHPHAKQRWRSDSYPTGCQICGEIVSSRKKHWLHVRQQHPKEIETYQPVITAVCDTCGKGFQNSTKLRLHQLRHRSPSVRCASCPRVFYDHYAVRRHARTHCADTPHVCRTCGRGFKLRTNLDRHFRVHTDIAPYECTMCGKKFKYSSGVNLHVRTVHYKLPHPPRKKKNKAAKDTTSPLVE